LRYLRNAHQALQEDKRIHLAITLDGRQALGEILVNLVSGSIGYTIGADHRGQRLATRALLAVTEYACGRPPAPRRMAPRATIYECAEAATDAPRDPDTSTTPHQTRHGAQDQRKHAQSRWSTRAGAVRLFLSDKGQQDFTGFMLLSHISQPFVTMAAATLRHQTASSLRREKSTHLLRCSDNANRQGCLTLGTPGPRFAA
jgi:hypothetical protein